MFERYTERARRVIFFARYEASQFGSTTIETEHFLLGLIREDKNLANRFLRNNLAVEGIREEIEMRAEKREKVSTSTDLPLTPECKRILAYAAEEAERLQHRHIGTEHLLLGILREEKCVAARVLVERGLALNAVRESLAQMPANPSSVNAPAPVSMQEMMVPNQDAAKRIAEAIWLPLYGVETIAKQLPVQTAVVKAMVWHVTAGPFFAFIRMMDGKVLAVGQSGEGTDV